MVVVKEPGTRCLGNLLEVGGIMFGKTPVVAHPSLVSRVRILTSTVAVGVTGFTNIVFSTAEYGSSLYYLLGIRKPQICRRRPPHSYIAFISIMVTGKEVHQAEQESRVTTMRQAGDMR